MRSLSFLAVAALLVTGCHHFPHVKVSRHLVSGHELVLSHNRVCAAENDPIQVTFSPPDAALTWSLLNDNGVVRTGPVNPPFVLETKDLIDGRYSVVVKVDEENSLEANFEVFHCAD